MKRFLDLIEKTGDKVVITDPAGERPYVLMSLEQYEKLVLGTQEAPSRPEPVIARVPAKKEPVLTAKKDVSIWRNQLGRELAEAPIKEFSRPAAKAKPAAMTIDDFRLSEGEEQFYLEPLE